MLDFTRTNAEGQGAKGAVGRGVGVAADNGHAGLGDTEFWTNDVDDALVLVAARENGNAELGAVLLEGFELALRDGVTHRDRQRLGGHVVVGRGERAVGATNAAVIDAQAVEGLGRGDLVDEVQVDVDEGGFARRRGDEVLVPNLFVKGLAH